MAGERAGRLARGRGPGAHLGHEALLAAAAVAALLGISRAAAFREMKKMQHVVIGDRTLRVTEAAVETYVKQRTKVAASPARAPARRRFGEVSAPPVSPLARNAKARAPGGALGPGLAPAEASASFSGELGSWICEAPAQVKTRTLMISVLGAVLSLSGCSKPRAAVDAGAQTADYSQARARFKTTLLHRGPSPQPYDPVTVPEGAEEVEYRSGPLLLKAWIAPASAHGKQPAVLFLHGGFGFGADDWEMAQPFRDAGFAVMVPILRGENGQPGAFSMFYDEVDDVLAAATYLSAQPFVDPTRLYVAGHSVGGTLTLLAAQASTQFRAAASFSGSPNQRKALASGWNKVAPFDPANEEEVRMRSPLAFAESFKCPVRMYYGTDEPFFAAASRDTARLARARALDVESLAVPGDHFAAVPEEITLAIAFFRAQR